MIGEVKIQGNQDTVKTHQDYVKRTQSQLKRLSLIKDGNILASIKLVTAVLKHINYI